MATATQELDINRLRQIYEKKPTRPKYVISEIDADYERQDYLDEQLEEALSPLNPEAAIVLFDEDLQMKKMESAYAPQDEVSVKIRTDHIKKIAPLLDVGQRMANGLQLRMLETVYGQHLQSIKEDIKYAHHGIHHKRRWKKEVTARILFSPELDIPWEPAVIATHLFALHDDAQLDGYEFNSHLSRGELPKPIKEGHGEKAALKMLAMRDVFAYENRLLEINDRGEKQPSRLAKDIVSTSVISQLIHEYPETVVQRLHGDKDANTFDHTELIGLYTSDRKEFYKRIQKDPLIQAYQEGSVDLFSLSSQDIALITIFAGRDVEGYRPTITDQTPFGLHEGFETLFKGKLQDILYDRTPLFDFSNKTPEQIEEIKSSIRMVTYQAIGADIMDMVDRTRLSTLRTLTGSKSEERPFLQGTLEQIQHSIQSDGSHAPKEINSDTRRKIFEGEELIEIMRRMGLFNSAFITNESNHKQLHYFETLNELGPVIMSGSESKITTLFEEFIDEEREIVQLKLKKRGQDAEGHPIFKSMNEKIWYTIASLKKKPQQPNGELRQYDASQQEIFHRLCEMKISKLKAHGREYPFAPIQPYRTYESLSPDPYNMRTYVEHHLQRLIRR